MSDWLHNLPVLWMALVVFGLTYLVAAAIHAVVAVLAVGERARSFKAVSPGMLPPLGIIFGLFVAFTAAQVWNDTEQANVAVNREASALRSVVIFAASFPEELCFESTVRLEHSPLDAADLDLEDSARTFPVDYSADEMPDLAYCIERYQPDPENEVGR